jgi:hypothetical protein
MILGVGSVVCLFACLCGGASAAEGEKTAGAVGQPAPAPRRGRLPPYFARVATPEQRAALDQIQARYATRIDKLRAELEALVAQRDAELRAALGPEQRKQLDELELAARSRREARGTASRARAESAQGTDLNGPASPRAPSTRGTSSSRRQRP